MNPRQAILPSLENSRSGPLVRLAVDAEGCRRHITKTLGVVRRQYGRKRAKQEEDTGESVEFLNLFPL